MKIIQGLKQVKKNKEKIEALKLKIKNNSAHLSTDTPEYKNPTEQVSEWVQSCHDLTKRNIELLSWINKTNMETNVAITMLDGTVITRPIYEWILRRREYINMELSSIRCLTDRGLRSGYLNVAGGNDQVKVEVSLNYDPLKRDKIIESLIHERDEIDHALETVNAITDIIECSN